MIQHVIDYLGFGADFKEDFDTILLIDKEKKLTWGQFQQNVAAAALSLVEKGFHEQPIAVLAEHNADTLAWYLGVLASGNYYVPINPDIKEDKFEKIKAITGIEFVCRDSMDTLKPVPMEELPSVFRRLRDIYTNVSDELPMYIIFTSGSTGDPKGILKTHQGMISFTDAYIREFGFDQSTCLGNQTPFYFDASAKDIFTALKLRCTMHILDSRLFLTPLALGEYIRDNHINTIQWVPSALSILSRLKVLEKVDLSTLKKVLFVGEVFPPKQLKIWMDALPLTEFINLYGSSEMSGICTFYRIQAINETQTVPMGYPLSNSRAYLIDEDHLVTEPDQVGELYILSDALAAGYLKDEEKTAAVFTGRPIPDLPEGTYYRSGDLAKYGPDHELIFVSRRDYQIKHMGHRIELGEIESVTLGIPGVDKCCCLYRDSKILLYFEGTIGKADLSRQLRERLLPYMIPNKLIAMESLPLNANGKVDRTQL